MLCGAIADASLGVEPCERELRCDQGRRLAASYANFLIINGAVLMPAYEDPADREALDYWGVGDIDQPIGIVPFPCGWYVCPNHGDDQCELATASKPSVA